MFRSLAVAGVLALVLAGCGQSPASEGPDAQSEVPVPAGWRSLRHEWNRTLAADVDVSYFVTPIADVGLPSQRSLLSGVSPSEPTIGATSSGTLFILVWDNVLRSLDGGRSWHATSFPWNGQLTTDPYLHVDPVTDRIFEFHVYEGACNMLAWSDDEGATWLSNPLACNGIGGFDHPKVVTVDPSEGMPDSDYGRVLLYAYSQAGGPSASVVSLSFDGGLTWPEEAEVVPLSEADCGYGLLGKPAVTGPTEVHLPKIHCDGFMLASSADSGRTWSRQIVGANAGGAPCLPNPGLASDGDRRMAGFWPGADNRLWSAASQDAGATWSASTPVSPPPVRVATMPAGAMLPDGTTAVLYYATEDEAPSPDGAPPTTLWHAYVSLSTDGQVWTTLRLTDDPVQVGEMDVDYDCENHPDSRNLLDFIDLGTSPDGRFVATFTDGCIAECAGSPSMESSRSRQPVFASVTPP